MINLLSSWGGGAIDYDPWDEWMMNIEKVGKTILVFGELLLVNQCQPCMVKYHHVAYIY